MLEAMGDVSSTRIDSEAVQQVSIVRLRILLIVGIIALTAASCSNGSAPASETSEQSAQSRLAHNEGTQPAGASVEPASAITQESSGNPTDNQSDNPSDGNADGSLSDGVDSEEAEWLRSRSDALATASPAAAQFIADAPPGRLDALGSEICDALPDEPSRTAFARESKSSFDSALTDEERQSLDPDSWSGAFGAIALNYCQELVPSLDASEVPTGRSGNQMDQFRAIATTTRLPEETVNFIESSSDERLEELGTAACSKVDSDMDLLSLEAAVLNSYDRLSETEQSQLTPSGFGELYLDLLGFFCFENIPQ